MSTLSMIQNSRRHNTNMEKMVRTLVVVAAVCVMVLQGVQGRHMPNPFVLQGRVYCDTCRAGFETSATTYIHGAKVRVECKNRNSQQVLYSVEGVTDSTGTYRLTVKEDHLDQLCDVVLVSSPLHGCATADPGRDRSRVILTRYNGIAEDTRFANALGFMKDEAMSGCSMILQQYQESED